MKVFVRCLSIFALVQVMQSSLIRKSFRENENALEDFQHELQRNHVCNTSSANLDDFGSIFVEHLVEILKEEGDDTWGVDDVNEGHWWGRIKLTDITISGVTSLYSADNIEVTYCHESKQLQIDALLGFHELEFESNYDATVIGLGPSGRATGSVSHLKMIVSIIIDFSDGQADLNYFDIVDSGHLDVDLHGHPLIDWMFDLLLNTITFIFKWLILDEVDRNVREFLDQVISIINALLNGSFHIK